MTIRLRAEIWATRYLRETASPHSGGGFLAWLRQTKRDRETRTREEWEALHRQYLATPVKES